MENDANFWTFFPPVVSGIVVALVVMLLNAKAGYDKRNKRRLAYLNIVKLQLENNKKTIDELKKDLDDSNILPDFDVSIIHNFLSSEYIKIDEDKDFMDKLQVHLDNLAKYKIAVQQLLLYNADFTSHGVENATKLKVSLSKSLQEFKDDLDGCIVKIKELITVEETRSQI